MKLRVIDQECVRALLPMERCIELMGQAFRAEAEGRAVQPLRQVLPLPDGRGALGMMPGILAAPALLGIKVVSVFPGNFGTEFGSHQGPVLLFDTTNGRLLAMIDARAITAIRTAAASAAATDALARSDASSLGLFGYGEQAREHADAISRVRSIRSIVVWGRDSEKARTFAQALGAHARAVDTPEAAAKGRHPLSHDGSFRPLLPGRLAARGPASQPRRLQHPEYGGGGFGDPRPIAGVRRL